MVSEMGGGQPPSPAAMPGGPHLDDSHPVGVVTTVALSPRLAGPAAAKPSAAAAAPVAAAAKAAISHDGAAAELPDSAHAMQMDVDAEGEPAAALPPPSRSPSPIVLALKPSAAAAAMIAAEQARGTQEQPQQQQASSFVPVGDLDGSAGSRAASLHAQPALSDGEPSSLQPSAMERPASATGYESGDDMDMLSMRHCTNCTGPLWGHICMDCGHMTAHDDDIFHPTVAPASTMHRPRLQVRGGLV